MSMIRRVLVERPQTPMVISNLKLLNRPKRKIQKFKKHGRGQKGWKARHNRDRPHVGYEGGQYGILKAIPLLGNAPKSDIQLKDISIDTVQYLIKMGRLNGKKKITLVDLHRAMPWNKLENGFRLESNSDSKIDIPIHIEIQAIDPTTVRLIESAGGTLECKYYSKLEVNVALHPSQYFLTERFKELSLPKFREDILNYANKETRGYLSHLHREELARLLRHAPSYTVMAKEAAEKEAAQLAKDKAEAKKAKMRNRRKYR